MEKSLSEALLVEETLDEAQINYSLTVARDREEALTSLRRESDDHGTPWPDLLLLDLDLPKVNGHELLADLSADSRLESIPVVVLTGSREAADIRRAFSSGLTVSYVTKPLRPHHVMAFAVELDSGLLGVI